LHVNSQSLVLADYGVKTGYCQLCGASLLRFSVEMFPASLRLRQKTRVLQQNVKNVRLYSVFLAYVLGSCRKSLMTDYVPIIRQ
jgi:hypothetical protein